MKLAGIKQTKAKVAPTVAPQSTRGVEVPSARIEPEGLDSVYGNPEFAKAADNLINVIERQIVFTEAREYSKAEVLDTANKILESRMK